MSHDSVRILNVFGKIRREMNLMAISHLKGFGLHPKQMVMLRFLHDAGASSLTQLARGTATDIAAASRAIGPLKRSGWLRTRRNPTDQRSWIISLTPLGEKRMPELDKIFRRMSMIFSRALTPVEQRTLLAILNKVSIHLKTDRDPS